MRLRSLEGAAVVETDGDLTRARYLAALGSLTSRWKSGIVGRGGRFLQATTRDPAVGVVRDIIKAIR